MDFSYDLQIWSHAIFVNFKRIVEIFFPWSIKAIQIDGAGELIPFQHFLTSNCISYRQTCPHTHHQNGSVECWHHQIIDIGLALLAHSNVPFTHWDNAFDTTGFLINRLPTVSSLKPPFELLFHKPPIINFFKLLCMNVGLTFVSKILTNSPTVPNPTFSWVIANPTVATSA